MQPTGSEDRAWREIEALFTLLEGIHKDKALKTTAQLSIAEDEIRAKTVDKLVASLQSMPYAVLGKVPPYDAGDLLNEAIYEILDTYADYRGKYSLKDFSCLVVRNKVSAYLRQQGRYVTMEDDALEKLASERDKNREMPRSRGEGRLLDAPLEDIFRSINVDKQQLSEKELLVFVLKVANFCMEKKLPEVKLAAMVGLKRTTFRDMYQKARDKIYQQCQARAKEP